VLREAVEQAIAQGRLRDIGAATAAQVLWSAIHGATSLIVTFGPDKFPVDPPAPDLVEQVMAVAMRGLLADGGKG